VDCLQGGLKRTVYVLCYYDGDLDIRSEMWMGYGFQEKANGTGHYGRLGFPGLPWPWEGRTWERSMALYIREEQAQPCSEDTRLTFFECGQAKRIYHLEHRTMRDTASRMRAVLTQCKAVNDLNPPCPIFESPQHRKTPSERKVEQEIRRDDDKFVVTFCASILLSGESCGCQTKSSACSTQIASTLLFPHGDISYLPQTTSPVFSSFSYSSCSVFMSLRAVSITSRRAFMTAHSLPVASATSVEYWRAYTFPSVRLRRIHLPAAVSFAGKRVL
jgi:hypothetical protein